MELGGWCNCRGAAGTLRGTWGPGAAASGECQEPGFLFLPSHLGRITLSLSASVPPSVCLLFTLKKAVRGRSAMLGIIITE